MLTRWREQGHQTGKNTSVYSRILKSELREVVGSLFPEQ